MTDLFLKPLSPIKLDSYLLLVLALHALVY